MYNDPNQQPQQPQNPYELPPTKYARPPYKSPYGVPSASYEPTQYAPQPLYEPTQYAPPPPPYKSPYDVPPIPGYTQVPLKPKRSLRWLWITLSIIGGITVLSCAGSLALSFLGYNILSPTASASATANSYYQAIENKDYATAYNYLANDMYTSGGQAITLSFYTNIAQADDLFSGPVTSFTQTNSSINSGKASVTMSIKRNGNPYVVYLQLQQNNGNWQITQYNGI